MSGKNWKIDRSSSVYTVKGCLASVMSVCHGGQPSLNERQRAARVAELQIIAAAAQMYDLLKSFSDIDIDDDDGVEPIEILDDIIEQSEILIKSIHNK